MSLVSIPVMRMCSRMLFTTWSLIERRPVGNRELTFLQLRIVWRPDLLQLIEMRALAAPWFALVILPRSLDTR